MRKYKYKYLLLRVGSKMYAYNATAYAFASLIIYAGSLYLIPLLGIKYFFAIAFALNLLSIPISCKCLKKPTWKTFTPVQQINS